MVKVLGLKRTCHDLKQRHTLVLKKPLFQKRVMAAFIGDVLGLKNDSHVQEERHASL